MKFRKLRIAWSVAWGVLAVLLCVFWARSYGWVDSLAVRVSRESFAGAISVQGSVAGFRATHGTSNFSGWWAAESEEIVGGGMIDHRLESSHGYRGRYGFSYVASPLFVAASVPDWFLFDVAIAMAVAPWAAPYARFSLRTLFIAMTVVAVVLGVVIYFNRTPATPAVDVGDFGPHLSPER